MALRKQKRVRRHRGSRTHGYGRIGQHRKGGQRGGKGKAGGKKHDWTYTTAKEPDRYGKQGFHRPSQLRQQYQTINVGDLIRHLDRFTEGKKPPKQGLIAIDLTAFGYNKVLGGGNVTLPLDITAPIFTHRAAEKIKAVGGKIKGTIQEPTKHPTPSLKPKPKAKPKAKPKPKAKKITAKPKAKAKPKSTAKPKRTTSKKSKSKT